VRFVVFGSTGTAGSEAARQAALDPRVSAVLAVMRRPVELRFDGVETVICEDLSDLSPIEDRLAGIDVCLYCLGIAQAQATSEEHYRSVTYDLAITAATTLRRVAPNHRFHFLSGQATNVKSRMMWARIKGETEIALQSGDPQTVCWRPGYIHLAGLKPAGLMGRIAYQTLRAVYPKSATTNVKLARAMLQGVFEGLEGQIVENTEINQLAARYDARRRKE